MPKSVLTDVSTVTWKNDQATVDVDAQVVEWSDIRKYRGAVHEYLKRDGSEVEPMGRYPHRTRLVLVYCSPSWRKDFLRLVAATDANPLGTLVHPIYGAMSAFCEGYEGAKVSARDGVDCIDVPVSFIESAVDQQVQSVGSQGPAAKAQEVTTFNSALTGYGTKFLSAASTIVLLANAAATYADAAATSATTAGSADASLSQQLASVYIYGEAAAAAIRADIAATNDAVSFDAIATVEQVLDACAQLEEAVKASRPTLIAYTVPATTALLIISQQFYGREAFARLPEILANNAGVIHNAAAIPLGTVLFMATPTLQV